MGLHIRQLSIAKTQIVIMATIGFAVVAAILLLQIPTQVANAQEAANPASDVLNAAASDTEKPTVQLLAPGANTFNPTVIVSAHDDNLKNVVANMYYAHNDEFAKHGCKATAVNGITTQAVTCTTTNLADGQYYAKYNASDLAGNVSATRKVYFTIDTSGPSAPTLITPTPYVANGATKTLSWNPVADADHYEYAEYNNVAPASPTSPMGWTKDVSGTTTTDTAWQSDVTIYWRVRAVDAAGNKGVWSETRSIMTDRTKPVVTTPVKLNNGQPAENTIVSGVASFVIDQVELHPARIYVEYMQKDAVGKWQKMTGQETLTSNSATFTVDTTKWSDGEHQIKISTSDVAGNKSGYSFTITTTNTADPVVVPVTTTIAGASQRTVTGTVSDNAAQLSLVKFGDVQMTEMVTDFTVSQLPNQQGTYNWSFVAPPTVTSQIPIRLEVRFKNTLTNEEHQSAVTENLMLTDTITVDQPAGQQSPSTGLGAVEQTDFNPLAVVDPIGQFVAPFIASASAPVQSLFFGTPVPNSDVATGQQSTNSGPEVLGATDTNKTIAATSVSPVESTGSGWRVMGLNWYWYGLLAAVAAVVWWLIIGRKKHADE